MTDVVVEMGKGEIISYYIKDKRDAVTLVTPKSSILTRKVKVPRVLKSAMKKI